jgi:hypothetical protein
MVFSVEYSPNSAPKLELIVRFGMKNNASFRLQFSFDANTLSRFVCDMVNIVDYWIIVEYVAICQHQGRILKI